MGPSPASSLPLVKSPGFCCIFLVLSSTQIHCHRTCGCDKIMLFPLQASAVLGSSSASHFAPFPAFPVGAMRYRLNVLQSAARHQSCGLRGAGRDGAPWSGLPGLPMPVGTICFVPLHEIPGIQSPLEWTVCTCIRLSLVMRGIQTRCTVLQYAERAVLEPAYAE